MEVTAECCSGAAVRGRGNAIMLQAGNYLVRMLKRVRYVASSVHRSSGSLKSYNGDSMPLDDSVGKFLCWCLTKNKKKI